MIPQERSTNQKTNGIRIFTSFLTSSFIYLSIAPYYTRPYTIFMSGEGYKQPELTLAGGLRRLQRNLIGRHNANVNARLAQQQNQPPRKTLEHLAQSPNPTPPDKLQGVPLRKEDLPVYDVGQDIDVTKLYATPEVPLTVIIGRSPIAQKPDRDDGPTAYIRLPDDNTKFSRRQVALQIWPERIIVTNTSRYSIETGKYGYRHQEHPPGTRTEVPNTQSDLNNWELRFPSGYALRVQSLGGQSGVQGRTLRSLTLHAPGK